MAKNIKVNDDVYWALRGLANEARVSVPVMVEKLIGAEKNPAGAGPAPQSGWKAPATETAGPRVSNLPARPVVKDNGGSVVPPAPTVPPPHQRTKDDERAKVERMKAALAAMPAKPPLNPKDVYADRKVRDDDDPAF